MRGKPGGDLRKPLFFDQKTGIMQRSDASLQPDNALDEARKSSLFVGSTEKAFQVLHAFDGPRRHLTLADIARAAGLDRSATQRLVYTLEALGYVRRIPDTKMYGLAPKVLQFSLNYIRANELIEKASPYLLDISRDLGETANLHELDGHEVVFLARFHGQHMFNVDIAVGSRLPAFFTASGTAILSQLPLTEQMAILGRTQLDKITPFTETDPAALMARVQAATDVGYAVISNETVMGNISVASAITDESGRPVAAVNISVPTTRWTVERAAAELAQHVQVVATSISKPKTMHARAFAAGRR